MSGHGPTRPRTPVAQRSSSPVAYALACAGLRGSGTTAVTFRRAGSTIKANEERL